MSNTNEPLFDSALTQHEAMDIVEDVSKQFVNLLINEPEKCVQKESKVSLDYNYTKEHADILSFNKELQLETLLISSLIGKQGMDKEKIDKNHRFFVSCFNNAVYRAQQVVESMVETLDKDNPIITTFNLTISRFASESNFDINVGIKIQFDRKHVDFQSFFDC